MPGMTSCSPRYVISKHQDTQVYDAILPQHLTNQAMRESEAYLTYHAYATGEKTPKPKSTKKKADSESSPKTKLTQASKGKSIKTVAKGDKPAKKKQSVTKLKGVDEGTSSIPGVPDVPTYKSDDEQISWKSSKEEDDDDEVNASKDNDDDADNDDDVDKDDEDDDADNQDDESNEDSDEKVQGAIIEEEEMDEEATQEEDEANELYRDVDINFSSVSSGFISNMLNPSPDTGIDTIFTSNTEATSLVDVPVTTIAEPPLLLAITLLPTPLITHLKQTPVPLPATVPSSSLQDLPKFGSLFRFDHRLKILETEFFEFKQTNQFANAVSSIPGIVDAYLANKMHEAIKTAVQLQSERLRDEAQAENADFLNKLDDNFKKIIKDQVKEQVKAQVSKILLKIEKTVNEQLEAEVMTRSSTESKTSLAIAANLSELELKKILIDKMEINKRRDDEDKDEEPSAGSTRGSKRRRAGKEPESTSAPKEKISKTSGKSYEGSKYQHKTAGFQLQRQHDISKT
ncbi:hypothetical protein Tco_0465653 [Tanacetum coccineum]